MKVLFIVALIAAAGASWGCGSGEDAAKNKVSQVPQVTAADEMAARVRLHAIADAEGRYQIEAGGEYGTIDQLKEKGYLLDQSGGQLNRYKFDVVVRPHGFDATAVPEKYGVTGVRSFYIDESQTLRGADKSGAKATATDPTM